MRQLLNAARWIAATLALVPGLVAIAWWLIPWIEAVRSVRQNGAGSGGIGAVSAGCSDGLFAFAPFLSAQMALRMAAWRGAIHPRYARWHLIASVILVIPMTLVAGLVSAYANVIWPVVAMLLVFAAQIVIMIGALVLAVRGRRS